MARILEDLIKGYEQALGGDFDDQEVSARRPRAVEKVLKRAVRRRWRHLAEERLEDVKPTIPLGKHFWALGGEERRALRALFQADDVAKLITSLKGRSGEDAVELIDAAYWMKGCSSLGRLRYAALLRLSKGGGERELCLVDIKEAAPAAAPRAPGGKMPRDNAERVVTGARALSPNLGERMMAARLLDKPVVIRELMPQDLKIEIDGLTRQEAMSLARYLAGVVGRAHGRQMQQKERRAWLSDLAKNQKGNLEAPSWLWTSVVELLALHEAAYLEHCRRFALSEAA
jgi:uncharacterized protein (DUF2252 family)